MKLKTKLILGLGFLFLLIFALAAFCSYYVGTLGRESDNILKDNYASLVYSRNMLAGLDDMKTSVTSTLYNNSDVSSQYYQKLFDSGKSLFGTNLKAESGNITEIHEKEYVETLNRDYGTYLDLCSRMRGGAGASQAYFAEFLPACEKLKQTVNAIYDVNMEAVVRKSQLAKSDTARFLNSMAIIGSLCLMLALVYFWYFPVYISTTLSHLAGKMGNLLKGLGINLDTETDDEAYVMLHAINLLENRFGIKEEGPGETKGDRE